MLIVLNKKIKQYYRIPPEDIPQAVYSPEGMSACLYKQFFLYEDDYINNVNVKAEIINVKHVKRFSIFNYNEVFNCTIGREYLKGANTRVVFNDNSTIYVTESINEIANKTGAT